jgi:hypothetical protein
MSYMTFTQKRPNAKELLGLDLVNILGANEYITSVSSTITLKSGVVDSNIAAIAVNPPYFANKKIGQLIGFGLDGNYYFITFLVTTTSQTLEFVTVIPVSTGA